MILQRTALAAALATIVTAAPLAAADAQYAPCNPFPLTWPFCVVDAAVGVATAPFRAIAGAPYPYYYPYGYYYPPRYYRRYYRYYGYPPY